LLVPSRSFFFALCSTYRGGGGGLVVGHGVAPTNTISPAQAFALAKRAAVADAYRMIAERIADHRVTLERITRFIEIARDVIDPEPTPFAERQLTDVRFDGLTRRQIVLDAIEARSEHGREREIRIGRRVRTAELNAGPGTTPRRHAHERRAMLERLRPVLMSG
jgi:hypothetical protein